MVPGIRRTSGLYAQSGNSFVKRPVIMSLWCFSLTLAAHLVTAGQFVRACKGSDVKL